MAGLNKEIEQLELQIKFLEIEIQKANTVNVGLQKQLTLTDVSQQRELLLAFFDLADELPMGLSNYDREKIVEEFLANNCG